MPCSHPFSSATRIIFSILLGPCLEFARPDRGFVPSCWTYCPGALKVATCITQLVCASSEADGLKLPFCVVI